MGLLRKAAHAATRDEIQVPTPRAATVDRGIPAATVDRGIRAATVDRGVPESRSGLLRKIIGRIEKPQPLMTVTEAPLARPATTSVAPADANKLTEDILHALHDHPIRNRR